MVLLSLFCMQGNRAQPQRSEMRCGAEVRVSAQTAFRERDQSCGCKLADMWKRVRGLAWMFSVLGISGCASYGEFLMDQSETVVTDGTVEFSGSPGGPWSFRVEDCSSGMREGFFGVTLASEDGQHAVRIVRNPVGPMTVALSVPNRPGEFAEMKCRAVVGEVHSTNVRINAVPVVAGSVRFACENVRGAATFTCS